MKKAFVSLISTNDFLPGILALNQSLHEVGSNEEFVVLIANTLSKEVKKCFDAMGITNVVIEPVSNPNSRIMAKRFEHSYTKLRIFERTEYEKLVYIDADMLLCESIDELFERPEWSAVNAGGMLPECNDWTDLNSGLLVIEPRWETFDRMMKLNQTLPSSDGGDQGFLHSFFPEWSQRFELHLDHKYNMYVGHLERYSELYGYHLADSVQGNRSKSISALHFWGSKKPWSYGRVDNYDTLYNTAFRMWWNTFERAVSDIPEKYRSESFYLYLRSVIKNKSNAIEQI